MKRRGPTTGGPARPAGPRRRLGWGGLAVLAVLPVLAGLAPAAALAGDAPDRVPPLVVRTPQGPPAGGAAVVRARPLSRLHLEGAPTWIVDEAGPTAAVFDAEGRLASLPRRAGTTPDLAPLVVRRVGSVLATLPTVLALDPGETTTLVLADASPLAGRLRRDGDDGPTLEGASELEVLAFPRARADGADATHATDGGATDAHRLARRAVVAPDGGFRFDTFPDGERVRLLVRRRAGAWVDLGEAVVGAGVVERPLPRGATVLGRVLDGERGRGVEGLVLRLRTLHPRRSVSDPREAPAPVEVDPVLGESVSGEDGRFAFAGMAVGRYEVDLVGADGGLERAWVWDGDAPRIDVDAVARKGDTVRRIGAVFVRRRGAIVGQVRSVRGDAPLAGATVVALPAPDLATVPGGADVGGEATSDAQGAFQLEGLAPGPGWRVLVTAAGRSPLVSDALEVVAGRAAPAGLLRLDASWRADLRVLDPTGRPVVGARVTASPVERPVATRTAARDGPFVNGASGPPDVAARAFLRRATTDEDGLASLHDLAEGDAHVVVTGPGVAPTSTVVPAARTGASRLVTVVVARAVALVGRLETRTGTLPRVVVRATRRDDPLAPGGVLEVAGLEPPTGRDAPTRAARPDPTGRFTLDDLPPVPHDVEVTDEGGVFVFARAEAVTPGGADELVLVVRGTHAVEGFVLGIDRDGPATTVALEATRYDDLRDAYRPVRVATTTLPRDGGGHGTFSFADVPPGFYAVRAVQGERDSGPLAFTVDDLDVRHLDLRLAPPSEVEGVVVDERVLAGAFGATVRLLRLEGRAPAPGLASRATTTDAYGQFRFAHVAEGRYRVEVVDREAVGREVEILVGGGERVRVEGLALTFGGRIEGRVEDVRGNRVGGLPIRVWRRPDLVDVAPIVTRADGTFRSGPLAAGRYRLFVTPGLSGRPGIDAEVEVVDGEVTEVVFAPLGGGRVEGVVARRGVPAAGVALELTATGPASIAVGGCDQVGLTTVSDPYGGFAWDGLPEGRYVLRVVDASAHAGWPIVLRHNDRVRREIALGEGEIRGVVRHVRGDPIGGADVRVRPASSHGGHGGDDDGVSYARTRTGPDGRFAVVGLPLGRYRVFVSPAHGTTRTVDGVMAEPLGQAPEFEVLVGGGGRLDLRVADDRGRPVAAAEVWLEGADGAALHPRAYFTGTSGRVSIGGVPEGTVYVRVLSRGHGRRLPVPVEIRDASATPLDVTLRPGGRVRLAVAAGRERLALARVEVRHAATGEWVLPRQGLRSPEEKATWVTTGRQGVVELEDLEPGRYVLTVGAASVWAPQSVEVIVTAQQTTSVGVTLLPR